MSNATHLDSSAPRNDLRLWPGIAIAAVVVALRYTLPLFASDGPAALIGPLAGLLGGFAVLVWWTFFSRAPRLERFGGALLVIAAFLVTGPLLHESIATGQMGFMFPMYAVPALGLALVTWAVATRNLSTNVRRATMVATVVLACGGWTLVRTYGIVGSGSDFAWRWEQTPEERLLASAGDLPLAPEAPRTETPRADAADAAPAGEGAISPAALPTTPPADVPPAPPGDAAGSEPADVQPPAAVAPRAAWPGFRGAARDGVVRGLRVATDWSASPPVEMWRRAVGPGWSSFAVRRDVAYTQEQRGEEEIVAAYDIRSGEPVWMHADPVRFWESNAGAGPRATPTLHDGVLYAFGATGILNALDADDGAPRWSRNAATDANVEVPGWGFASSPLVVGDLVIVAVSGKLAAYDRATGEPRWFGEQNGESYASPHLLVLGGTPQVVLLAGQGATSVAPRDGAVLWKHAWPGFASLQPALVGADEVLVTTSGMAGGYGVRRLSIAHEGRSWSVEERWMSTGLKPYFNDFVVHEGHAYGFDGRILSCIELENGEREWKGGRFGNGQLVLLPAQDLLLVLSDRGELALVAASPAEFRELARVPAIEGKTWNHPAVVDDVVLVRNDREMAAFRLPLDREG